MTTDLHHLAAAYALDALSEDERRDFEAHYPTCEICADETREFRGTATLLAIGVTEDAPVELRNKVMDQIRLTRQVSPILPEQVVDLSERRARNVSLPRWLAAAAVLIVALAGGVTAAGMINGQSELDQLIASPDSVVTDLEGGDGFVRVVWSPTTNRAAFIGSSLPDPGRGKTYQLWFLIEDGVASAGLFEPNDRGEVSELRTLPDVDGAGWGVTIEPAGGSEQPTSEVLYSGSI